MKKVLFIDRDGTIIKEADDEQIDGIDKLVFYPKALYYLSKMAAELDYELIMVTNQDGLGTSSHPEENFWPIHNLIMRTLEGEGIVFKELGAKAIWLRNNDLLGQHEMMEKAETLGEYIALQTQNWVDIYTMLKAGSRTIRHERNTNETKISIELDLDGTGKAEISTGLHFFDHMLDQIARHGSMDLKIKTNGDLHIDEHHTIEDTGIALGEAFAKAIGNKLGLERYGFCLPMDDCLAQAAIDFGGRAWIVWDAEFKREKVGDVPTEMFYHFFKSFTDAAKCNLNIKAEGENEHHKIESIFKAFAKAIKMAIKRDAEKLVLPSTKGVL
ncbi:MAG: imidazoleglycerol-phosphate dehydratase HisB [Pedobacter sp.]|nr:MAG: imidazoleglycerol-phosphate dehydratase HisB [Pedobacter sp.]